MGHARSNDLVKAFNDGFNELDLTKLVEISMDGPNSNLKFLSEMKKLRLEDELASLIDIGSCNIHVIHGAFKTGSESSGWNLHKILKVAITLLHDTRLLAEMTTLTWQGLQSTLFSFVGPGGWKTKWWPKS